MNPYYTKLEINLMNCAKIAADIANIWGTSQQFQDCRVPKVRKFLMSYTRTRDCHVPKQGSESLFILLLLTRRAVIEVTICQYKFCGFVVLTSFSGIFQNINSCLVPTVVRNSSHSLPFMKQQNSLWSNTIALLLLLGTFVLHYRPTCFLTIPFTVASCERSVKN